MKKFETTPHTADVGLLVEADSPEELFRGALLGMSGIMNGNYCNESGPHPLSEKISLTSIDQSSLVIDFLNEVIAFSDEDKAVFCTVDFTALTNTRVEATVFGGSGIEFDKQVKAATYHGALIHTNDSGNLEVRILFDI